MQIENSKMICIDVTDSKFLVYTQGGILIRRESFKNLTEKYGHPVEVSNNGLIFIFKHSD